MRWLLLLAFAAAQLERKAQILCCMQLTRARLGADPKKADSLSESSPFPIERVMTTVMIQMITHCTKAIPLSTVNEMMQTEDVDPMLLENMYLVPLPEGKTYTTEEDLQLNEEEAEVMVEVETMIKEGEANKDKPLPEAKETVKVPAAMGYIYVALVFAAVAGCIACGFRYINKPSAVKKRKSR
jgi:hypothetical protein